MNRIEELLEEVFSVGSMQRLYKEGQLGLRVNSKTDQSRSKVIVRQVPPDGGMGGRVPIVGSRCVATPSENMR
jgi:hypothetical protein